jgi:hypothetical protein
LPATERIGKKDDALASPPWLKCPPAPLGRNANIAGGREAPVMGRDGGTIDQVHHPFDMRNIASGNRC